MQAFKGANGIAYSLPDRPIAQGGEGAIYTVSRKPDKVAKLYNAPTEELRLKLSHMVANPPEPSVLGDIAWPVDLLYDDAGDFRGFVMPRLDTDCDLKKLYPFNPGQPPLLTYRQRVIVAQNICVVIAAVHQAGYVFGDFNPLNTGVNLTTGHVGFFDTDSYHFTDPSSGRTYRCGVCLDGYAAPELIARCKGTDYRNAPLPTFTKETDLFALAIHIFRLLMNGYTPFNGIRTAQNASTASPGIGNKAIEAGNYCFAPGKKPQSEATPALDSFPPEIRDLFSRAFLEGAKDPSKRPTAEEWKTALESYKMTLQSCSVDPSHDYWAGAKGCPYCEANRRYAAAMVSGQFTFSTPAAGAVLAKPTQHTAISRGSRTGNRAPQMTVSNSYTNSAQSVIPRSSPSLLRSFFSSRSGPGVLSRIRAKMKRFNPGALLDILFTFARPLAAILLIVLPVTVVTCNHFVEKATYSEQRFSISVLSKTENVLRIRVESDSSEALRVLTGDMKIRNRSDGRLLYEPTVTLTGSLAGKSSEVWDLELKNASTEVSETDLEDLVILFRITALSFENGKKEAFTTSEEKTVYEGRGKPAETNPYAVPASTDPFGFPSAFNESVPAEASGDSGLWTSPF